MLLCSQGRCDMTLRNICTQIENVLVSSDLPIKFLPINYVGETVYFTLDLGMKSVKGINPECKLASGCFHMSIPKCITVSYLHNSNQHKSTVIASTISHTHSDKEVSGVTC